MDAALFLDRDGVIIVDHGYVHRIDQVEWMPGIFETARLARRFGLSLIVVTNQSGIARRYYSEADFQALMAWMGDQFVAAGAPLTRIYHCPYHPDGYPPYDRDADCRKPRPGMLLTAARELRLDLAASVMIGDQEVDIGAATRAGLRASARLSAIPVESAADIVLADHSAACRWLTKLFSPIRHNEG